jgi:ATPase subunit of ABC transporter with duplicated ATPase domains
LIKILLGELEPLTGNVLRTEMKAVYADQDYSLVNSPLSIEELVQKFNVTHLPDHEVKTRLDQFLFAKTAWSKSCHSLSGGEKMRLTLCCLSVNSKAPDMIILDEPTNNLDIQNIGILTRAVNDYEGTLLVISHDEYFLKDICVTKSIMLE